jgi:hypothetical protein
MYFLPVTTPYAHHRLALSNVSIFYAYPRSHRARTGDAGGASSSQGQH